MNNRSKRLPTKAQQIENVFDNMKRELYALQILFHNHLKECHNLTDVQIKEFHEKTFPQLKQNRQEQEQKTEELKVESVKKDDVMKLLE